MVKQTILKIRGCWRRRGGGKVIVSVWCRVAEIHGRYKGGLQRRGRNALVYLVCTVRTDAGQDLVVCIPT